MTKSLRQLADLRIASSPPGPYGLVGKAGRFTWPEGLNEGRPRMGGFALHERDTVEALAAAAQGIQSYVSVRVGAQASGLAEHLTLQGVIPVLAEDTVAAIRAAAADVTEAAWARPTSPWNDMMAGGPAT